jgi:hypothetical protein
MSTPLDDVCYLAGRIGSRGTGTPAEADAADYVAGRLADLGLPVERRTFRAVASQNAFPLSIALVALLAVVIYPLDGALARWIAATLALLTPFLLWQAIIHSDSLLGPLLPHVTSRNVVTRLEPQGELCRRAVVLAHMDTNRCRLVWQSSTVRHLEPLTWLTLAILILLGMLYITGALLGGPAWIWWLSLLPAGYQFGSLVTLWRDECTPFSPGAHDNAASVAVALGLAERLAAQPLQNTQVWLAFTGAEETDHAGLKNLLREHDPVLREAAFIDMEGVGSGEIVYLTRQGLCLHYRPSPDLLALAEKVADRQPDLDVHAAQMTVEDEVRALRGGGYRAICIAGRDPGTGSLPHWHRADDTADTVSAQTLEQAAGFVMAMVKALDDGESDIS